MSPLLTSPTAWAASIMAVVAAIATGCSTVSSRIAENQAYFNSLPASDRNLIQKGRIKAGLDEKAVYIALGKPSRITRKFEGKTPFKIWVYTRTRPAQIPNWSYTHLQDKDGNVRTIRTCAPLTVWDEETSLKVTFKDGKVVAVEEF